MMLNLEQVAEIEKQQHICHPGNHQLPGQLIPLEDCVYCTSLPALLANWWVMREILEDLVNQFAYEGKPVNGVASITPGGSSALQWAFKVLGYLDPHPMPHKQCQATGCTAHATCGTPTPGGYKRLCATHYALTPEPSR